MRRAPYVVGALVAAGWLGRPAVSQADRAEAQWSARGVFGTAQLREEGARTPRRGLIGGMSLSLSYGLSNYLDVSTELLMISATQDATFADTTADVGGITLRGKFTRGAASALMLVGPTWRLGVAWVPVISLSGGVGVRYRSAGSFPEMDIAPEERGETVTLDLGASAKVGLEYRVNHSLTVGAYGAALAAWGPKAPLLPVASASVGLSYVLYPLW
ncbi:MAG: hypothetical protein R3B48_18525 [Kofleriaceae bacterium]